MDDYPNPLLLPPSPSTTRFMGSSSVNVSTLSSSPLRPTLHSMASSSSLSSSLGSVSGAVTSSQASNGVGSGAIHGHQQATSSQDLSLSSSAPTNVSTSPTSQPLATNSHQDVNSVSSTANAGAKSVMNITNPSFGNTVPAASVVASASQQNIGLHHSHQSHQYQINPHSHQSYIQQQHQHQQYPHNVSMHMLMATPEPRPLMMESLRRNDDLLEELQLTVNDLSQWLEVFETGIKSIRST